METTNLHRRGSIVLSALCALGAACSSGSSSGGTKIVPETYSIEAFDYEDPSPPQPLQRVRTDVVRRDEAAILLAGGRGQLLDYNDHPGEPGVQALPSLPWGTFALTTGRIDSGSDAHVLAAHLRGLPDGRWNFELSHLERTPTYGWMPYFSMPAPLDLRDVAMGAGDIDADGLDEVAVAFRGSSRSNVQVLVLDDLDHGGALLESHPFVDECGAQLEVALGDLDGDGSDEIVLSAIQDDCITIEILQEGDVSNVFDDYVLRDRYTRPSFVRLGEFDGEPACEEILVGFFDIQEEPPWGPLNLQYRLVKIELLEGALEETGSTRLGEWPDTIESDWVVADSDGDWADEVFLVRDDLVWYLRPDVLLTRPSWVHAIQEAATCYGEGPFRLAAGDEEGDGRDEVLCMGRTGLTRIAAGPGGQHVVVERRELGPVAGSTCILMDDYDGDSTVIAHTGRRELVLCEAFPLVVMAVPPWKSGAAQQVAEASTGYRIEDGSSHTTWSGATLTGPAGLALQVDGLFKRALLREFAITGTSPELEGDVAAFATDWREDMVLFCGVLYQSYGYDVVADRDPTAIGRAFTIDVPVAERTFFWSVDHYNESFERKIGPRVLGHVLGDPETYMGFRAAQALAAEYVGWMADEPQPVGAGGGYTAQELDLPFAQPTTEWDTCIHEDVGLRTGEGGVSIALASVSDVHRVTTRTATVFSGQVGDLSTSRFDEWGYDYGLLVYTRGQLCEPDNTPSGYEPGVLPCQVVTYATDPWGSGYGGSTGTP